MMTMHSTAYSTFNTATPLPTIPTSNAAHFCGFISDMSRYDIRYCYHHINKNSQLSAKPLIINGQSKVGIYFQDFLIGTVPASTLGQNNLDYSLSNFQITIQQIFKRKYLPIESIWIEIKISDRK